MEIAVKMVERSSEGAGDSGVAAAAWAELGEFYVKNVFHEIPYNFVI
jgi:hypothetical protein